jgi:anthranilate synthase/aminodeoxychorismate synthase-like glutamine amidotransferase
MKILLIDNYDSFTYNLYHYLSSLNCKVDIFRNDKIKIKDIIKKKYKKIVISPGPGNPNQAGNCLKIVKHFYKTIPILGVCLGHQVIGQAFKSKIIVSNKIMHGKTSVINHNKLGIFKGIKKKINATRYHSLVIERKSLSKNLIITAETKDKVIMGIMHKKYNIHGVQFHPESIKTPDGINILKNFLKYKKK